MCDHEWKRVQAIVGGCCIREQNLEMEFWILQTLSMQLQSPRNLSLCGDWFGWWLASIEAIKDKCSSVRLILRRRWVE
jgi:hypothetical protein